LSSNVTATDFAAEVVFLADLETFLPRGNNSSLLDEAYFFRRRSLAKNHLSGFLGHVSPIC
jgi:hypothetical protein